jgi:hypothetical protein
VLDGHQHGAAPFAANAKALSEPQHDQRHHRPGQSVCRLATADAKGRNAHDHSVRMTSTCGQSYRRIGVIRADWPRHDPAV